jgi:hypothetical protein
MSSEALPTGPDPEAITQLILETYPATDVVTIEGGAFFSLDAEKHFPNFATIVWTDDFDQASNLSRPGAFRLNLGVSRATFERLVGSDTAPDYTATDRLVPHPPCLRAAALDLDPQPDRRVVPGRRPPAPGRGARPARRTTGTASHRQLVTSRLGSRAYSPWER